ncbi:acetate/propionate kinase [Escherichia coli]|uniref:Acetate/propionate kinase n=1 Tax=Escherichia coli TaxID=562 RepID=A0A376Y631_ECOLX|nr:acetate/propionate kinase [Escherichia coli]
MVVWTLLYSLVVSVKMPQWFVNCLWANWACWALKLIMNATWLHVSGKSGFINKEGTRPAVVIPTNEELVIAQDASRLTA